MTPLYLRQVVLAVEEIDEVVDDLCAIFDTNVVHVDPSVAQYGVRNAVLALGTQFIELVSPISRSASAHRFIVQRGEGLYAILLQCDHDDLYREQVEALGIRRIMDLEYGDFRCFQAHPTDAGISVILEIDRQPGGPDGPYFPGGNIAPLPGSTDLAAIRAVHMPSSVPRQVATRWSQLLTKSVSVETCPVSVIIDNAALMFPQGPTRTATLEIAVASPEVVVRKAMDRGIATERNNVFSAGVRLNLSASDGKARTRTSND